MSSTTVQRGYVLGCMVVLLVFGFLFPSRPIATATPDEQRILYAQVPTALDPKGKPPVAAPAVSEGSALTYMTVPRFGENWLWTVVEGTALDDLARGPGHYAGTPLMGAHGNFAVAGHRAGHGDPFIDFDLLKIGDEVTFRQNGAWWTYTIYRGPELLEAEQTWVLRQPPAQRRMTLTTCWPKYGSEKRLFVRGELTDWSGRDD